MTTEQRAWLHDGNADGESEPNLPAVIDSLNVHQMPKELWKQAKKKAIDLGITVSQYVINALREAVEKK
jgi:predicted HicB family RNase H-like nuclease